VGGKTGLNGLIRKEGGTDRAYCQFPLQRGKKGKEPLIQNPTSSKSEGKEEGVIHPTVWLSLNALQIQRKEKKAWRD